MDLGESYAGPTDMRVLPSGLVMLGRAAKEAVVFMRPSCADDCELKGGAAFVDAHNASSSARYILLVSFIVEGYEDR